MISSIMLKRAIRMSPSAAHPVARTGGGSIAAAAATVEAVDTAAAGGRCIPLSAPTAGKTRKSRFCLAATARYTAATASVSSRLQGALKGATKQIESVQGPANCGPLFHFEDSAAEYCPRVPSDLRPPPPPPGETRGTPHPPPQTLGAP